MKSVRAVLFDFGGVLTSSPFEAFSAHEARVGLPPGTIRTLNATNPDSNAWARLERREVDAIGFRAAFESEAKAAGFAIDGAVVLELLRGELRAEMVRAVHTLAGHPRVQLGLLTNNFIPLADSLPGNDDDVARAMVQVFDAVVESALEGIRKPELAFYELALSRLGVSADEAVFLDDLGINLKPARAMGMETIKVETPHQALRELTEVLARRGLRDIAFE